MRAQTIEAPPAYSELDPETGLVESEFIIAFRDKFIASDGSPKFTPAVGPHLAEDFAAVFRKLYLLVEGQAQPASGNPGTAEKRVSDLLAQNGWDWPNATPEVHADWKAANVRKKFRRYEIAAAMNILMQVRCLLDGGNNPPGWPPKKPV